MILACQNISKAFGTTEIIKNASFHIEEREKAALVGINGAGKSTLLKIIIGEMRADEGEVILSKGKTMGYLAQHQDLTGHLSIYQEVLTAKQNLIDMEERLRQMESDMKTKSVQSWMNFFPPTPASPTRLSWKTDTRTVVRSSVS